MSVGEMYKRENLSFSESSCAVFNNSLILDWMSKWSWGIGKYQEYKIMQFQD